MIREAPPKRAPETGSAQIAILPGGVRLRVSPQNELIVRPERQPEAALRLEKLLQETGVNVLATSPDAGPGGRLMLVVDDVAGARAALAAAGLSCAVESVLLIEGPRQLGLLAMLGQKLWKQGIGICHSYVSALPNGQMAAVFKTTDDRGALKILVGTPPEPSRFAQPVPAPALSVDSVAA